jgi:hypothetical protein
LQHLLITGLFGSFMSVTANQVWALVRGLQRLDQYPSGTSFFLVQRYAILAYRCAATELVGSNAEVAFGYANWYARR